MGVGIGIAGIAFTSPRVSTLQGFADAVRTRLQIKRHQLDPCSGIVLWSVSIQHKGVSFRPLLLPIRTRSRGCTSHPSFLYPVTIDLVFVSKRRLMG